MGLGVACLVVCALWNPLGIVEAGDEVVGVRQEAGEDGGDDDSVVA